MKILLCASEAAPYAKTGGLADVIGALPKALKQNGQDVRVIMPYYKKIKEQQIAYYQGYAYVRIGSQTEYVGVFHAICDGVDFYFIDKVSSKRNPGYPLDSISINPKYNKYFVELTEEEKKDINEKVNDDLVVDFIVRNVN